MGLAVLDVSVLWRELVIGGLVASALFTFAASVHSFFFSELRQLFERVGYAGHRDEYRFIVNE